jgi:hypothetical protein
MYKKDTKVSSKLDISITYAGSLFNSNKIKELIYSTITLVNLLR